MKYETKQHANGKIETRLDKTERDKSRHDRDKTETRQRQDRDKTETIKTRQR